MTRSNVLALALVMVVASAVPLVAQIQTGSVLVRVSDEQGASIPGVTVTLSSGALVRGSVTGVTDTGGASGIPRCPRAPTVCSSTCRDFRRWCARTSRSASDRPHRST